MLRHNLGGVGSCDSNLKQMFKNIVISCGWESKYDQMQKMDAVQSTPLPLRSCMEFVKKLKGVPVPEYGIRTGVGSGDYEGKALMMRTTVSGKDVLMPYDPDQRCVVVLGGKRTFGGFFDFEFSGNSRAVGFGAWGKNFFGDTTLRINLLPMPYFKETFLRQHQLLVARDDPRSMVRAGTPSGLEYWLEYWLTAETAQSTSQDGAFASEGSVLGGGSSGGGSSGGGSSSAGTGGWQHPCTEYRQCQAGVALEC
jgi:uncharacterized membrane protein YgcG